MNLAKIFDEIIKENQNNEKGENNFDDVKIFQRKNNARLNIEELFREKINPSFKFYMIKNIKVVEELINTALKEDNVTNLFKGKINYIPFWVFLIRNMSELYILLITFFLASIHFHLYNQLFLCVFRGRQPRNNILNISWSSFCSHF